MGCSRDKEQGKEVASRRSLHRSSLDGALIEVCIRAVPLTIHDTIRVKE
jgi:hypothetical protein